jgi:hypothetical protein
MEVEKRMYRARVTTSRISDGAEIETKAEWMYVMHPNLSILFLLQDYENVPDTMISNVSVTDIGNELAAKNAADLKSYLIASAQLDWYGWDENEKAVLYKLVQKMVESVE